MSKPFLGYRLRQAVQFLCRKAEQRARAETTIKSTYQSQKASVEAKYAAHEQLVQEVLSEAQAEAIRIYQERTQSIESRFAAAHSKASEEWAEARLRCDQEYTSASEESKAENKEALWTIETILEADTKVAKDELVAQQRLVGKTIQDFDAAQRDIVKLLSRWEMLELFEAVPADNSEKSPYADHTAALQQRVTVHEALLQQLRRLIAPRLLRGFRLVVIFLFLWLLLQVPALWMNEWHYWVIVTFLAAASIGAAVRFLLGVNLRAHITRISKKVKENQVETAFLQQRCLQEATDQYKMDLQNARTSYEKAIEQATNDHRETLEQLKKQYDNDLEQLGSRYEPLLEKFEQNRDQQLRRAEDDYQQAIAACNERFDTDMEKAAEKKKDKLLRNQTLHDTQWQALVKDWTETLARFENLTGELQAECYRLFPDWSIYPNEDVPVPTQVPLGIRFGQLEMSLEHIPRGIPRDKELRALVPGPKTMPALLDFPCRQSLLIKAKGMGHAKAVALLQAVMLRCLLSLPPGKARFTIIDPVGLGENFAAFAHLADYDEKLVTSRIWSERGHIEKRLADLTEQIETIIQNYLRNQFETLEEYNAQAGEVAEPYRFLVIASFPANFTDEACKRLLSIVQSGLRCGIQTLILVDEEQPPPEKFNLRDLEENSAILTWENGRLAWQDPDFGRFPLTLDAPPTAELCTALLHLAGERAGQAAKVEVPFQHIAPPPQHWWKSDSRDGIRVALGKAGATRKQFLDLGKGTAQHVLVAGKTGSGKSTLLHALIVQLALSYSPDEIELYLIDFKKGVEFKAYAIHNLPHARVVAIESEREFGLSVLKRLDEELRQRGDLFRDLGVHDVSSCRAALQEGEAPAEPLPRVMLIVDEFQEFFVEDDRIAQEAALLLDRLVRQGRAFGIHVLLGSQTLGGAYSLARSTIDQMAVRIALQCSEADGHLILNKDNYGTRLLSRPGEAIYNDANGLVEGNHLFQVVWMPDPQRDQALQQVQQLAQENHLAAKPQIVFEGNAPALLDKNPLLHELLTAGSPPENLTKYRAWLGDSIAIKDPTAAVFSRQSGSNLLIVGQQVEGALSTMTASLISLAAALPPALSDFYILCDSADQEEAAQLFTRLGDVLPQRVKLCGWEEIAPAVGEIAAVVEQRVNERASGSPLFLFIHGLQRFRNLRRDEDDFGFSRSSDGKPPHPSKHLASILRDGPSVGVFTILWCDTFNNLQRFMDRQLLREFDMRVLFQMNANDSSNLIDSPLASRLGLHRALYYTEDQGKMEKFRPYALPSNEWLEWVGEKLAVVRSPQ